MLLCPTPFSPFPRQAVIVSARPVLSWIAPFSFAAHSSYSYPSISCTFSRRVHPASFAVVIGILVLFFRGHLLFWTGSFFPVWKLMVTFDPGDTHRCLKGSIDLLARVDSIGTFSFGVVCTRHSQSFRFCPKRSKQPSLCLEYSYYVGLRPQKTLLLNSGWLLVTFVTPVGPACACVFCRRRFVCAGLCGWIPL